MTKTRENGYASDLLKSGMTTRKSLLNGSLVRVMNKRFEINGGEQELLHRVH